MVKWLISLAAVVTIAAIAALVWSPGAVHDETPPATLIPLTSERLPPPVQPGWRERGPLSAAELRWCMTQDVRIEAVEPHLATQPAVDRYNHLAADFNDRCGARKSSDEDRERVTTVIAASRQAIESGAIEEFQQLNDSVPVSIDRIQELLSMLGYDPGDINGEYGAQTRAAIEAFQRQRGRPADGLLSEDLFEQLARAFGQLRIRIERCRMRNLRDASEQQSAEFEC